MKVEILQGTKCTDYNNDVLDVTLGILTSEDGCASGDYAVAVCGDSKTPVWVNSFCHKWHIGEETRPPDCHSANHPRGSPTDPVPL